VFFKVINKYLDEDIETDEEAEEEEE